MLIPIEILLIFIPTALALNMTPGNDMLFCLGQGIKSGPRAGLAASFGIATGAMIHTLLADWLPWWPPIRLRWKFCDGRGLAIWYGWPFSPSGIAGTF